MNDAKDFQGVGWSFPPTFSSAAGTVLMSRGPQDIEESIRILISTLPGERVMLPEYGAGLTDLSFRELDASTKVLFFERLQNAIVLREPRINVIELDLDLTHLPDGLVRLVLTYELRANNSRFNFVYPFYLEEGSLISQLQPS